MSVRRCQQEITSAEFAEWLAYDKVEPGNPQRADAQTALICLTMYNLLTSKEAPRRKLSDYMLEFNKQEEILTPAQRIARSKEYWRSTLGNANG